MSNYIKVTSKGDFSKTFTALDRMSFFSSYKLLSALEKYGQEGVEALAEATPKDTGETAASWSYDIERKGHTLILSWRNSKKVDGQPLALMLQIGHGTNGGGYVEGIDYINPAMKPIFDDIASRAWEEVSKT